MKWLTKRISLISRRQGGFSLVETVVAVAIIGTIGVVLLRAVDANNRTTGQLDQQTVAQNMIAAAVENIRNRDWDYTDDYSDLETSVPSDLDTSLVLNIVPECNIGGSSDVIVPGACVADSNWQKISLTVTDPGGTTILRVCTFRAAR